MATKGGEERKGDVLPVTVTVPVITGASCIVGLEYLVAWFACFHAFVTALVLTILILGQEFCQDNACAILVMPSLSLMVQALAWFLALLFTGWWRRGLAFFALLMVIVTVKLSVPLIYVVLPIRDAVAVEVVVVVVLSFWGAKCMVGYLYGPNSHSQQADGNRESSSDLELESATQRIS